jgi:hypothetical protein
VFPKFAINKPLPNKVRIPIRAQKEFLFDNISHNSGRGREAANYVKSINSLVVIRRV